MKNKGYSQLRIFGEEFWSFKGLILVGGPGCWIRIHVTQVKSNNAKCRHFLLVYQTSCAHIQQLVPDAKSGYCWVHIKDTKAQVYCDMGNYGMNALYPASLSIVFIAT